MATFAQVFAPVQRATLEARVRTGCAFISTRAAVGGLDVVLTVPRGSSCVVVELRQFRGSGLQDLSHNITLTAAYIEALTPERIRDRIAHEAHHYASVARQLEVAGKHKQAASALATAAHLASVTFQSPV